MLQSDIKNTILPPVTPPLPRCVRNELLSPASCHTIPIYLRRIEEEILMKAIAPLAAPWREEYPRFQKYFIFNTNLSNSDPIKSALNITRDSDNLPLVPAGSSAPRGTTCLFPVSVFLEALKLQSSYYINGKLYHFEQLVLSKRDSLIRAYNSIAPRIRDLLSKRTNSCPKQLVVSFMIAWAEYEEVWVVAKEAHSVDSLQPLSESIHCLLPLRISQARELELPWPHLKHQMLVTLRALDCFLRSISTLTAYAASTLEAEGHHDPRLLVLAESVLLTARSKSLNGQNSRGSNIKPMLTQPFAALSSSSPSDLHRVSPYKDGKASVAHGAKSNFGRALDSLTMSTHAGSSHHSINYDSILSMSPETRKLSPWASPVRCPPTAALAAKNPANIPANIAAANLKTYNGNPAKIFEERVAEFDALKRAAAHARGDFSVEELSLDTNFAAAALHVSTKKVAPPPAPPQQLAAMRLGDPLPFSPSTTLNKTTISSTINHTLVASPMSSILCTSVPKTALSPFANSNSTGGGVNDFSPNNTIQPSYMPSPDIPSMSHLRRLGVGKNIPLQESELKEEDEYHIGERPTYATLLRFDTTRVSQLADDSKAVQRSKRLVRAFEVLRRYLEQVAEELEVIDPDMDVQSRLVQVLVEFERAYKMMAKCYLEPDNLV